MEKNVDRFLSAKEVKGIVLYSMVHIRRLEQRGEFPQRIQLGPNRIAWSELEIVEWVENKKRDRSPRIEGGASNCPDPATKKIDRVM